MIAADPGTEYLGLAVFEGAEPVAATALHGIAAGPCATYRAKVRPWLQAHPATRLVVERPPPTAHRGQGPRIGQAAIGFPLGLVAGLLAADFAAAGHRVDLVEVSAWRAALEREPNDRPRPQRAVRTVTRSEKRGFMRIVWSACGHETELSLQRATSAPLACPTCAAPSDPRDDWKRRACAYVARRWPGLYGPLVADARERARTDRPDHRLAGVSDACEAVVVGHAVATGVAPTIET